MKKLTKDQLKQHEELLSRLTTAQDELKDAVTEFNDKASALRQELQPKIEEYNEAVAAANSFVEEIHEEQQNFFDEKSEGWQEGDAGSNYTAWMDEWGLSLEEASIDDFEEIEAPDTGDVESFDQLPTEMEG